jgi:hypothetical protein
MPFVLGGLTVILIQILCAVHCVRSGRNQGWLMLIIFLPLLGSGAYFFIEVLPGLGQRREVKLAKAAAVRRIDPEREIRAAREALETADTAANQIALADRLAELERWDEAVPHYRDGIAKSPRPERGPATRLARVLHEAGRPAEALAVIEALPATQSNSERDRAGLLRAKVLEELGQDEAALALYRDVGERLPGGEAQCREAAVLMRLERRGEALAPLEEVERRLKRLDKHERRRERDMYDWALRTLGELRGS